MSGDNLFLEVAGGKTVSRFLISAKKHEFVIGGGKEADFQIGKRGLKDAHIKLTRNPNTGQWHAQDLSGDLFLIKGSEQKRTTAAVDLQQAITLNGKCIIRLSTGKASLSERFLSSKSVGGMGPLEYLVIILAPISLIASVYFILQNQPKTEVVAESDSHYLKCYAVRTGNALTKYEYGSTYLERVWPDDYYDCVRNAEASCQVAHAETGENRQNYRDTYKDLCYFLSEEKEQSDDGIISVDYYTSEKPAERSLEKFKEDQLSVGGELSSEYKAFVSEVCFSCDDPSKLNEQQRAACQSATAASQKLQRSRELWSSGRSNDALTLYRNVKSNTNQACEAYKAADLKTFIIRNSN